MNVKQNGRSWGRRQATRSKSGEEMLSGEDKTLEKRMEKELIAAQEAGGDVDRLVMKKLLAGVRDSGPNTAYKALASIEVRSSACALCGVNYFLGVACCCVDLERGQARSVGRCESTALRNHCVQIFFWSL